MKVIITHQTCTLCLLQTFFHLLPALRFPTPPSPFCLTNGLSQMLQSGPKSNPGSRPALHLDSLHSDPAEAPLSWPFYIGGEKKIDLLLFIGSASPRHFDLVQKALGLRRKALTVCRRASRWMRQPSGPVAHFTVGM